MRAETPTLPEIAMIARSTNNPVKFLGITKLMRDLTNIWREVRNWPPEQRLALATRLLQSLQREEGLASIAKERQEALQQLIGIWKTEPPPTDEQVERILEQERQKKYG